MLLKYIYTFFLGLLIAIFVGVGISVFYVQPTMPKYPTELNYSYEKEPSEDAKAAQKQYDTESEAWNEAMKPYNRNVSIIAMLIAVALVAIGLSLESKNKVIADGVTLGGVFTLVYSMGRGFASMNTKYTFALVAVGLIVVLVLGFKRFVEPHEHKAAKKVA